MTYNTLILVKTAEQARHLNQLLMKGERAVYPGEVLMGIRTRVILYLYQPVSERELQWVNTSLKCRLAPSPTVMSK